MGRPGLRSRKSRAARTSPDQLFSEVIDLRLQSVELFLGRIVSGPQDNDQLRNELAIALGQLRDLRRGLPA